MDTGFQFKHMIAIRAARFQRHFQRKSIFNCFTYLFLERGGRIFTFPYTVTTHPVYPVLLRNPFTPRGFSETVTYRGATPTIRFLTMDYGEDADKRLKTFLLSPNKIFSFPSSSPVLLKGRNLGASCQRLAML